MTKPIKAKIARKHAIALHAAITRHRATQCAAANILTRTECAGVIQCAHIIPKLRAPAIATALYNAWPLCEAHHKTVDTRPDTWLELVMATCGILVVQELRAENHEADDEGMPIFGDDDRSTVIARASKLHFWRAELHRLARIARAEDDGPGPPFDWGCVPQWVQALPQQQETTHAQRS